MTLKIKRLAMKSYVYVLGGVLLVALGVGGLYLSGRDGWGRWPYDSRGRGYLRLAPAPGQSTAPNAPGSGAPGSQAPGPAGPPGSGPPYGPPGPYNNRNGGPGPGYGPGPDRRGNQWWGPMMGGLGRGRRGGWGMMGYGPNRQALPEKFTSNGQQIFLTGTSQSGDEITARIGYMQTTNGSTSCADCHLEDGRGGSWRTMMGSFRVPNITYPVLTSRQQHEEGGRKHPSYTDATIKRAITQGVDPAGQPLQPPMPRWSMSKRDLNDLLAYLKTLR